MGKEDGLTDIQRKILKMDSEWWKYAETTSLFIQQFKKHVIPLLITGYVEDKFQFDVYTGFFLQSRSELIWISAGHVIDAISALLASPNFRLKELLWLDGFPEKNAEIVRFHQTKFLSKSWKNEGVDIGVLVPTLLDKENLLLNKNVIPIDSKIWLNLKQAQPEGYYAVGFPKSLWNHTSEIKENGKILHTIQPNYICLPLVEIPPPIDTDNPMWNDIDAFYGKIVQYVDVPEFDLDHVKGMSGGPLLSIERTPSGGIKYRLVGIIQSYDWSKSIIRAEPIHRVSKIIDKWLEEINTDE